MADHITTFNLKLPSASTSSTTASGSVETGSASALTDAFFRKGPVYSHFTGGLNIGDHTQSEPSRFDALLKAANRGK